MSSAETSQRTGFPFLMGDSGVFMVRLSFFGGGKETSRADVGKMTIDYLIPLHKPLKRHVGNIVYLKKSVGLRCYTYFHRPLEKSRHRQRCFFYIETIFRDPDRQRSVKIAVKGKAHFLVQNF
jgi:hypothetical protein